MTPFAALALYPLWALALTTALVTMRLGRGPRTGLVMLCGGLAVWVTGLILLVSGVEVAERVVPLGMILAGAVLHAGFDVAKVDPRSRRRVLALAYGFGGSVAIVGAVAPRAFYGPGAHGPGPLFFPLGVIASLATVAAIVTLLRLALEASGGERRRRLAVALACVFGALGGGGVIALRVLEIGDVQLGAPFMLVAIVLAGAAVLTAEDARVRDHLMQGAVQSVVTALLSAFGLTLFFLWLPRLSPDGGATITWLSVVIFFAALPLEPLRMLVVERAARALFRKPVTVPDLAVAVESSEARADQAERLAELGRVVSAVAHELRNPLGVIVAQAKLLERRGVDPEALQGLRSQVERARLFLDDLLRYGKPRPLEIRAFDAGPAIELAISNARQAFGTDAARVEVDVEHAGRIEADRNAFVDVITVLVENACIALEGSSAITRVSVRVRAMRRSRDQLVVTIEDDGPGVPPEIEATLFQPFVTGRGRDALRPGTGLGLAIAARWVERHGGELRHERPTTGGGARFVVCWRRRA